MEPAVGWGIRACSSPWGLWRRQWVEVVMHFNTCARKYALYLTLAVTLDFWSRVQWHFAWRVPKAAPFQPWVDEVFGSLIPTPPSQHSSTPQITTQGFRKRNSSLLSCDAIYRCHHQDYLIKVYLVRRWCFFMGIEVLQFLMESL